MPISEQERLKILEKYAALAAAEIEGKPKGAKMNSVINEMETEFESLNEEERKAILARAEEVAHAAILSEVKQVKSDKAAARHETLLREYIAEMKENRAAGTYWRAGAIRAKYQALGLDTGQVNFTGLI